MCEYVYYESRVRECVTQMCVRVIGLRVYNWMIDARAQFFMIDEITITVGHIKILHPYHSHFIPEELAETSQICLLDTHILPNILIMRNTVGVTGKPIAV
jgi:hypothetical protein